MLRFRECWACLPWHRASFHCTSPGAVVAALHPVSFPCDMRVLHAWVPNMVKDETSVASRCLLHLCAYPGCWMKPSWW